MKTPDNPTPEAIDFDVDTEIDAADPYDESSSSDPLRPHSGTIDRDTDPIEIHDVLVRHDEAVTNDDRAQPSWPAASTLPFARDASLNPSQIPVRLDKRAPTPDSERPMVGRRYLNYEIRRRLARGSMGLVYEANHLHLQRRVAIKFLSPALLTDENMVYRFLGEAQAMARIEHPGIPTIFDFGQDTAGNAYLIMDYLEGESLAAKLQRTSLAIEQTLEVAAQTAEILAAAHAENIVHRDLKPENILLCDEERETPEGKQPIVRLIDFGICKARSGDERASTAAGNLLGTPRYMAPEQTYSETVSPKTDIYALGCVIFELVTGQAPFKGKLAELVDAHRHSTPANIREIRPDVSPRLANLVDRMLSKDPGRRPPSGDVLAKELRRCKRSRPVARQPTAMRRAKLPTPRAKTAQSALEDGLLNPERTPLPFHPGVIPRDGSPHSHGSMQIRGGTTQVTLADSRSTWILMAALVFAGIGLTLLSAAML